MASLVVQPINCTRKAGGESSADAMIAVIAPEFEAKGATVAETVRAAAFDIKSGACSDEGDGDDWPHIREKILAADNLIFGTPIWMGSADSVAKRVMERMDAFLEETDDRLQGSRRNARDGCEDGEGGRDQCDALRDAAEG